MLRRHSPYVLSVLGIALALALGACTQSSPQPTVLRFTTGQAASLVIGQPDFTTSGSAVDAAHVAPIGDPAVANGRLYLPDYANNRVLGFDSVPTSNGASADFVLGQTDFTSSGSATTQAGMYEPVSVRYGAGKLFVGEDSNNRVLIYNTPPTSTGAAPNVVVGQPDFTTGVASCTASGLATPATVTVAGSKLIVGDAANSRVLIFNSIPTSNGAAADVVLGQTDFTHCSANGGGTVSASGLTFSDDVWSDGTRLIVADADNNRVLIWNHIPTANDTPADVVVGQPDMTSSASGVGPASMAGPDFIASNGVQLFVGDHGNNRVLVFNSIPTANGASADVVLGQPDFTSSGPGTTASTFAGPYGLLVTSDSLIVADSNNDRYLVFRP